MSQFSKKSLVFLRKRDFSSQWPILSFLRQKTSFCETSTIHQSSRIYWGPHKESRPSIGLFTSWAASAIAIENLKRERGQFSVFCSVGCVIGSTKSLFSLPQIERRAYTRSVIPDCFNWSSQQQQQSKVWVKQKLHSVIAGIEIVHCPIFIFLMPILFEFRAISES